MATRVLIASRTLSVDTATVEFTNLSQDYNDLEFWISARAGSGSSGGGSVGMYFNDITTGYSQRTAYGYGLSISGTQVSGNNYMRIGSSVNPGDASGFSTDWGILFNYSSFENNKVAFARTAQPNYGASAAAYHLDANSTFYLPSPVTKITLIRDGGGTFATNSRFNVYGVAR
jgi:hypothetical protein